MNWDNSIKNANLKLLSLLGPEAGFLSVFVGLLWPDSETDPWDKVRERTENLINQKIAEEVNRRVTQTIKGLGGVLKLYNDTMHEKIDPAKKYNQFQNTHTQFVHDIPQF